jgi:hypothetical protein
MGRMGDETNDIPGQAGKQEVSGKHFFTNLMPSNSFFPKNGRPYMQVLVINEINLKKIIFFINRVFPYSVYLEST